MWKLTPAVLRASLALDPAPLEPPPDLHPAGVIAPLFFLDGEPHLLFTQRTFTVRDHQGQISFPGGVKDPGDPDLLTTALRETQEEIGLDPSGVEILGSLKPVATITGYWIRAYVALIPYPYDFRLNTREVSRILILPLEGFTPPGRWRTGNYQYQGRTTRVCSWEQDTTVIWGATARLLLDFLGRLGEHPLGENPHGTCLD